MSVWLSNVARQKARADDTEHRGLTIEMHLFRGFGDN